MAKAKESLGESPGVPRSGQEKALLLAPSWSPSLSLLPDPSSLPLPSSHPLPLSSFCLTHLRVTILAPSPCPLSPHNLKVSDSICPCHGPHAPTSHSCDHVYIGEISVTDPSVSLTKFLTGGKKACARGTCCGKGLPALQQLVTVA